MWPLAGPNIAKKGWPLQKLARVDRQTHFGTFNFWFKPGKNEGYSPLGLVTLVQNVEKDPKSLKSRFDPKVKCVKMGLSITRRHVLQRLTLFRDIWPR